MENLLTQQPKSQQISILPSQSTPSPIPIPQPSQKQQQQLLTYLRTRVLPILQPLQCDILTQKPADINQFSYFWLQNYKQQQNRVSDPNSGSQEQQNQHQKEGSKDHYQKGYRNSNCDNEADQYFIEKLRNKRGRRQKGRLGISGEVYSTIKGQQLSRNQNWGNQDKIKILVKLRNHIFFKNLSQANIEEIIKCMKSVTFKANQVVIKQGQIGDQLFLVDSGFFKCVIESKKQQQKIYGPGQAFGELALLYNTKRASTITAVNQGRLFSLDRGSFNAILRDDVMKKTKICEQTLNKNIIFSTMTPYEKTKLIQSVREISLPAGKYIIREGQIGDSFYIVSQGKLVAEKVQQNGEVKSVYYFKQGDYFGQIALIRNVPRQASVKTLTSSKLFFIERSTFKRLLGPFEKLLKRNQERYKTIKQNAKKTII